MAGRANHRGKRYFSRAVDATLPSYPCVSIVYILIGTHFPKDDASKKYRPDVESVRIKTYAATCHWTYSDLAVDTLITMNFDQLFPFVFLLH